MSNRQWLNPLVSMGASIIMCALLAASHNIESSPNCVTEINLKLEVITKKNDGPVKEMLIRPVISKLFKLFPY